MNDEIAEIAAWFECERCGHNPYHPDGRCDLDGDMGESGEFCTFVVCGRCWNRLAREVSRIREAVRQHHDDHFWQIYSELGRADPEYAESRASENDLRLWSRVLGTEDGDV